MSDEHVVGRTTYQIGDVDFTDNHMPIELVWEGLLTDYELRFVESPMPVLRKNQKEAELSLAAFLAECENQRFFESIFNGYDK